MLSCGSEVGISRLVLSRGRLASAWYWASRECTAAKRAPCALGEGGVKDFNVQQRQLGNCGAIRLQAQKPAQGGHEHS